MGTNCSNWNNAIELMNKQLQRRATALLQRRDPYNNTLDTALTNIKGWFTEHLEEDEKAQDRAVSVLERRRKRKEKATLLLPTRRKNGGTSLEIKKKLPTFLTPDGDLLSGSLEEFGDQLYCSPSKSSGPPTNITTKDEWRQENPGHGSSVFLTDLHSDSLDSISLEQKLTTKLVRKLSEKSISPKRAPKVMKGWQPLSYSALSEHSSVSELPVKGLGHMAHGRYSMWRPDQSSTLGVAE